MIEMNVVVTTGPSVQREVSLVRNRTFYIRISNIDLIGAGDFRLMVHPVAQPWNILRSPGGHWVELRGIDLYNAGALGCFKRSAGASGALF